MRPTGPVLRRWTVVLLLIPTAALARPYRAMVTRTAETTPGGNVEVGLRYQGFVFGGGRFGVLFPSSYHQLAAHARWGIIDHLELDVSIEALVNFSPLGPADIFFGDIPIGLQWTFIDKSKFALGVFGRVTLPTGPSQIDSIPPMLSDGTIDVEGMLIGEFRPVPQFRLMFNVGAAYLGVRNRYPRPNFEVPPAIKYGVAGTYNIGKKLLLALEILGESFFRPVITPYWDNNQHLLEVIPGIRFEPIPHLVLEAALGIAVTPQLREIHQFRPLLGLTYEFGSGKQ